MAVAVKDAVAEPFGTETEAGTVSLALFELRLTVVAEEAAPERVTVQEEEPAPVRLAGLQATPVKVAGGGVTVNCVVALPFRLAVNVAAVEVETDPAEAVKEAEVDP